MKKLLLIFFSLITVTVFAQQPVRVVAKPPARSIISDEAKVLTPEQFRLLDEQLIALDDSTSNQIGIAIIKTLNDGSLEEVAVNTYREWGLGTAKKDNGVLILVVVDDRKVKIEVGYGLEGAIPDAMAGSIIRNEIAPYFRQNDYYHGLHNAVEELSKAAAGEYKEARARGEEGSGGGSLFKFILLLIFIFIMIGRSGGGRGGRKGNMMSRRGSRGWMGPVFFPGGFGGGGFGGGGFGGGGFGGGGFGGFGGGSSGGGGASGSW